MFTLALIAQKGGVGKTTLAAALAVAHHRAGEPAALVDLDQQGSAAAWARLRDDEPPKVTTAHPPSLAWALEAAEKDGSSLVLIDTPPRERSGAAEAARRADLVLVPCQPSMPDLLALPPTLEVVAGTPAVVLLNRCPARGSWTAEATAAVRQLGAELCPVVLGQRVAHARAFVRGRSAQEIEPHSPAAAEVAALYTWLQEAR